MRKELAYYDIHPKIVPAGGCSRVTVRGLGCHADFGDGRAYYVHIMPVSEMTRNRERRDYPVIRTVAADKRLCFEYAFGREGQYVIWIAERNLWEIPDREWKHEKRVDLRMYALAPDLFQLRPAMGNMHVHTCRSDGAESPAVTAACYRAAGYDFIAITDHRLYEPSIEAIRAYEALDLDFRLFPGEEIHPADNRYHIVSFGGNFSIGQWLRNMPPLWRRKRLKRIFRKAFPRGNTHHPCAYLTRSARRTDFPYSAIPRGSPAACTISPRKCTGCFRRTLPTTPLN